MCFNKKNPILIQWTLLEQKQNSYQLILQIKKKHFLIGLKKSKKNPKLPTQITIGFLFIANINDDTKFCLIVVAHLSKITFFF